MPNRETAGGAEERSTKVERLEARITREQKELLQRAAELEGRSLTDFVVSSAFEKALRTLEEHSIIKLSHEDSIAFVESLLNSPQLKPDEPLARAINRYKESTGLA